MTTRNKIFLTVALVLIVTITAAALVLNAMVKGLQKPQAILTPEQQEQAEQVETAITEAVDARFDPEFRVSANLSGPPEASLTLRADDAKPREMAELLDDAKKTVDQHMPADWTLHALTHYTAESETRLNVRGLDGAAFERLLPYATQTPSLPAPRLLLNYDTVSFSNLYDALCLDEISHAHLALKKFQNEHENVTFLVPFDSCAEHTTATTKKTGAEATNTKTSDSIQIDLGLSVITRPETLERNFGSAMRFTERDSLRRIQRELCNAAYCEATTTPDNTLHFFYNDQDYDVERLEKQLSDYWPDGDIIANVDERTRIYPNGELVQQD